MEIVLIVIGALLVLAGVIGAIIPGIPGPPLSYGALLCLHFSQRIADKPSPFSTAFLIIFAVIAAIIFAGDYVIPIIMGKKYGISKKGTWGSIIGMILGILIFPPFGIIVGVLAGAIVGELIAGKEESEALRAGFGSFFGTMLSIVLKLTLAAVIGFFFVIRLIKIFWPSSEVVSMLLENFSAII